MGFSVSPTTCFTAVNPEKTRVHTPVSEESKTCCAQGIVRFGECFLREIPIRGRKISLEGRVNYYPPSTTR